MNSIVIYMNQLGFLQVRFHRAITWKEHVAEVNSLFEFETSLLWSFISQLKKLWVMISQKLSAPCGCNQDSI